MGISLLICLFILNIPRPIHSWNNGDSEDMYYNVRFGSHDWIAQKAMSFLPEENTSWYSGSAIYYYLMGTKAPDDETVDLGSGLIGYGDTFLHHNYYSSDYMTTLSGEDDASRRAQEEYVKCYNLLQSGDLYGALFYAGSMTHYIADLCVWGHVMNNESHHSDFEDSVNNKMDYPDESFFTVSFDGVYENYTAYESAFLIGQEVAGNNSGKYTAIWMDNNYEPFGFKTSPETEFDFRVEYLIDMVVNLIADTLYPLFYNYNDDYVPDCSVTLFFLTIFITFCIVVIIVLIYYLVKSD
jgi:hypothetical protein